MSRILKTGEYRITQGYSSVHNAVDVVKSPSLLDDIIAHSAGKVIFCQTGYKNAKGSKGNASYGNCVKIDHGNGYLTRYAHLENTRVLKGQKVTRGQRIGQVGMSGNSFAPHLHYEIQKDTLLMDPLNYLFASVSPDEYMRMLFMSVNTGQPMD